MRVQKALSAIVVFLAVSFISMALYAQPNDPNNKCRFRYAAYPDSVYVDSAASLTVCLMNGGGEGVLTYVDGTNDMDYVEFAIPVGFGASDLVTTETISARPHHGYANQWAISAAARFSGCIPTGRQRSIPGKPYAWNWTN